MIPSEDALLRHWKRACWVVSVWRQATLNRITYPPLDGNGWKQPDPHTLAIDWDSEANITQVRTTVALIKKGCGCKTGCLTARCKCKRGGNHCGPGCKCLRCCNLPDSESSEMIVDESEDLESEDPESDSDDLEREVDDIMNDIFGGSDCTSELSGSDPEQSDIDYANCDQ